MSFSGAFGRENENKYVSNVEFEVIKGRRTRIDTLLKVVTDLIYEFEVGVKLPDLEPVNVIGAYNKLENGHTVEASFRKAEDLYRAYGEAIYEPNKTGKLLLDVAVPSRRVKLMLGRSKMDTKKHVTVDLQWNADVNLDDRFLFNVSYDIKTFDDFELASTLHYPFRTIDFSIKHNSAARYITNIELAWSPKEKMELNIIFRDDVFEGAGRTELDISFESPFESVEELGLSFSKITTSEQLQSKSSLTWAKGKKILVTSTAKIPLSIESIDLVATVITPFKDLKTLSATVKHRFNPDLDSSVVVQWDRNRFSVSSQGQLFQSSLKRTFTGKFDMKTPFEGMRSLSLTADHADNYQKFNTKFTMDTSKFNSQGNNNNDGKYTFIIDMDHSNDLRGLSNTANVKVTMPDDDITAEWELSYLPGRARAMIDIQPRRGNRFKIELAETHNLLATSNKVTSKFELLIPTEAIQELLIQFSHEDRAGYVKTSATLTKDNLELISASIDFINSPGSVQLTSLVTSAYSEDVVLKFTSVHSIMPYRSNFEIRWGDTPWKITAESNVFYNDFGQYDMRFTIFTPSPDIQALTVTVKRTKVGLDWDATFGLSFGRQNINVNALYRLDHVKSTKLTIKTTFPQFPGLTTSVRLNGNQNNFDGDASFLMLPYVPQITTDFRWSYYAGSRASGAFNLNTPFPQYPYLKMSFDSNKLGVSRVSNFEIEYLPTQKVKVEADYRFTSIEELKGTVKITSPYTENKQVVADFTHIGNTEEFSTRAEINCECFKKSVYTQATFSSKKGLVSTFDMQSPFRGYENVDWSLNHQPKKDGYHTKASYETNGKKISFENLLTMSDKIQWQVTFLTPFANITRTHVLLSHEGEFPNTLSHAEVAYNEKMVSSNFRLTHNDRKSEIKIDGTTPFEKYETINAVLSKSGTLSDLTVQGDLNYRLKWHASLRHYFSPQNIQTSALFQCPYLEDDVSLKFNYTGEPLDSHLTVDYDMGSKYRSLYEARLLYKLPNIICSSKATTTISDDIRVNLVALKHSQKLDPDDVDISSQFIVQNKNFSDINLEFLYNYIAESPGNFDMLIFCNAELPIPNFNTNKLSYEAKNVMNGKSYTQGTKFVFETPLLEKITEETTQEFDYKVYMHKMKRTYGDMVYTSNTFWQEGEASYNYTTPHEGYEWGAIEITYTHPEADKPLKIFNSDIEITASSLKAPIKISTQHTNTFTPRSLRNAEGTIRVTCPEKEEVILGYDYTPGKVSASVNTTVKGYESSALTLAYSKYGADIGLTSSALNKPITYSGMVKTESWTDFDISHKFTSGFTNLTNVELIVRNGEQDGSYKPKLSVKYENHLNRIVEMTLEGNWAWEVRDTGNMKIIAGTYMKTPFIQFQELSLRLAHEHSVAPLRVREGVTVGFNSRKYLDVDGEFGALNKFYGDLTFRSPREMEFSFSALNKGESVDSEVLLNWNKQEQDSNFRMEFGLADTGNQLQTRKNFNMKIFNPGRTISWTHKYESSSANTNCYGGLEWDGNNAQKVSYTLTTTLDNKNTRSLDMSVTVPTRKVEVSGSFRDNKGEILTTATVHWDALNDRSKQVDLKLDVDPTGVTKTAALNVRLPSLDKVKNYKYTIYSKYNYVLMRNVYKHFAWNLFPDI